jgi:hypothetical protein
MNRFAPIFVLGALLGAYQVTAAEGGGQPSSKATASVGAINIVSGPTTAGASEGEWVTVLGNRIKTANQKDLFMDVALECGLHTATKVSSKGGKTDTSKSEAMIQVRVLVDGKEASPGVVVFSRRSQQLSATFQGLLDGALSVDPLTGAIVIDEALLQPEEVELITESTTAASFNFVLGDISSGTHDVQVQARIDLGASAQAGASVAKATVGKGSVTVEEVRMIKNEDFSF